MTSGLQAYPLPQWVDSPHILGLFTWGLFWFWFCFLTEDTHISHGTTLSFSLHSACQTLTICAMRNLRSRVAEQGTAGGLTNSWQHPGAGWWGLGLHCCPAFSLTGISPSLSVFILFAAEDPRLRPAGPPLSAQPSHPCSTRLRGECSRGVLVHLGAGASVVWAPLPLLALPSPCQDQAP